MSYSPALTLSHWPHVLYPQPPTANLQSSSPVLPQGCSPPPHMFVCHAMSYVLSDMLDAQLESHAALLLQYVFTFKTKTNHCWATMYE